MMNPIDSVIQIRVSEIDKELHEWWPKYGAAFVDEDLPSDLLLSTDTLEHFIFRICTASQRVSRETWVVYIPGNCLLHGACLIRSRENRVPLVLFSANCGVPFSTAQMIFGFYRACSMSLRLNECHYFQFNSQFWTLHEIIWETLNLKQEYAINQFFYIFFISL
jgi:hypothetical protein